MAVWQNLTFNQDALVHFFSFVFVLLMNLQELREIQEKYGEKGYFSERVTLEKPVQGTYHSSLHIHPRFHVVRIKTGINNLLKKIA